MKTFLSLIIPVFLLAACAQRADQPIRTANARTAVSVKTLSLPSDRRGTIPVTMVLPAATGEPVPVVLFSTGAFSSPDKYEALMRPWAEAGYAVLAPLHTDSERWVGPTPPRQMDGLAWRVLDWVAVMEAEEALEAKSGLDLAMDQVAATGHSFGALVAQVVGGAQPGPAAGDVPGIMPSAAVAIIAISPPGPLPAYIEEPGWAQMSAPQMLTTGDADVIEQFVPDWRLHLAGHKAHGADSWALVQSGVDHYFGNVIGRTEYPGPPQRTQFNQMVAHSMKFLDAFLGGDEQALKTLRDVETGEAEALGLKRK